MVRNILPQSSILSHNKTLLYFGHGGVNGLHEAAYFGKPVVAMPVWWDGRESIERMVKRGVALSVPKGSGADAIYDAVVRVRDDPGFKERASGLAKLMRDRRHSPLEDAVWLAEYVSKARGAGRKQEGALPTPKQSQNLSVPFQSTFNLRLVQLCNRFLRPP